MSFIGYYERNCSPEKKQSTALYFDNRCASTPREWLVKIAFGMIALAEASMMALILLALKSKEAVLPVASNIINIQAYTSTLVGTSSMTLCAMVKLLSYFQLLSMKWSSGSWRARALHELANRLDRPRPRRIQNPKKFWCQRWWFNS